MDTEYFFHFALSLSLSLFTLPYSSLCFSSTRRGATCKTLCTLVDAKRVSQFSLETHKEKSGKKRKREKPLSKDEGRPRGAGGRVTLRSIEQGNTIKVVRACPWKRGGTRILFFIRPDAFSLSLPRTATRTRARARARG